jgi:hypothetical protein
MTMIWKAPDVLSELTTASSESRDLHATASASFERLCSASSSSTSVASLASQLPTAQ